ncbi:MAG: O-antigen ligase family protein [Pseudomonadota bacterium]
MTRTSGRNHGRLGYKAGGLSSETAFCLFIGLVAVVMLSGGGSRADIASLGPLRALAAVLLAVAVWFQTGRTVRRVMVPLVALLALAVLIALQLVPLPPALWGALPGREPIVGLGELAGVADAWRPLTFSPMKTANSLASLVLPLAGLMLVALMDDAHWRRLPWVFIAAGAASAMFGIAQILLPGVNGLFLYDITNEGSAVGLFSNRNHNAMFLSVALLFAVIQLERTRWGIMTPEVLAAGLGALVIFAGILVNASRSGLVGLGLVGLIFAIRAMLQWRADRRAGQRGIPLRVLAGGAIGLVSAALVAAFAVLGRSPAMTRVLAHDPGQDLRVRALPTVLDMLRDFQPLGTGFGAFEYAFRMREPDEMLGQRYFNNVHNDWLQLPIEGGIPATILALVLLALFAFRCWHLARSGAAGGAMHQNAVLGALGLVLLLIASVIDYPLRTPSIMLLAAVAAAMVFKPLATSSQG